MTDAQRQGGGAAGADGDGTAHPPLPAAEAAPPGEPGTGTNSGPADSGDLSVGLGSAAPGEGLAIGGAQAPAGTAVAVAEAPPSAEAAAAAEEQSAPASPAPARQRPPSSGGQWRPWLRGSAIGMLLLAVVA